MKCSQKITLTVLNITIIIKFCSSLKVFTMSLSYWKSYQMVYYKIFQSEFNEQCFYISYYKALYFYLKNNNFCTWANSIKKQIIKTKLFLKKKYIYAASGLKMKILKTKKECKKCLIMFIKSKSECYYECLLKKLKKAKKNLKSFKEDLLFIETFKKKIKNL